MVFAILLIVALVVLWLLLKKQPMSDQDATMAISLELTTTDDDDKFEHFIVQELNEYYQFGTAQYDISSILCQRRVYLSEPVKISEAKVSEYTHKLRIILNETAEFLKKCKGKRFRSPKAKELFAYMSECSYKNRPMAYFRFLYKSNASNHTWFEALYEFMYADESLKLLSDFKKQALAGYMTQLAMSYIQLIRAIREFNVAQKRLENFENLLEEKSIFLQAYDA